MRFTRCGPLVAALILLIGMAGCAAREPATPAPAPLVESEPQSLGAAPSQTPAALPPPAGPITLTVWHRWPAEEAETLRAILDDYQKSRPGLNVALAYQQDMPGAPAANSRPDVLILPSDLIAESAAAGLIAPLDAYVDAGWLEENYSAPAVETLRCQGRLWGLPLHAQTLTFFYNQSLISDAELTAQTSQLLQRAGDYAAAHAGIGYLVYPALDAYFAAPWFYGAGAWYGREDGTVGLDTPAGQQAAAFIASLRPIMPADVDYAKADALFKAGQAAITVNGPWYVDELVKAGVPYGLQIMPIVSSSGQPARPLVTTDGAMLAAGASDPVEAVRLIAYLAGSESQLRLARKHTMTPTNKIAVERARAEGLVVPAHFAQQADLGQAMPPAPVWGAALGPATHLLQALWDGRPPAEALQAAQAEAEKQMKALPK